MQKASTEIRKKLIRKYFGFIVFSVFFFIVSAIGILTAEAPEKWKETNITVEKVSLHAGRFSYYIITDINGNTFTIDHPNPAVEQLDYSKEYSIIYTKNFNNRIMEMKNGQTVIEDYDESIDAYYLRMACLWVLFLIAVIMGFQAVRKIYLHSCTANVPKIKKGSRSG